MSFSFKFEFGVEQESGSSSDCSDCGQCCECRDCCCDCEEETSEITESEETEPHTSDEEFVVRDDEDIVIESVESSEQEAEFTESDF